MAKKKVVDCLQVTCKWARGMELSGGARDGELAVTFKLVCPAADTNEPVMPLFMTVEEAKRFSRRLRRAIKDVEDDTNDRQDTDE